MKVRIFTAIGIFAVGLPILLLSETLVFPIALGIICAIAAWELLRVLGFSKRYVIAVPTYIIAALMPFCASGALVPASRHTEYVALIALVLLVYLVWLICVSVLSAGRVSFGNMSGVFASVAYVTVSFTSLVLLRYMENGALLYGLVFVCAWTTDTFAYFTGRLFGKHKLAPDLSPKKTVEGSIGGIVFAILACLLYGAIVELTCDGYESNYLALALIGAVCSVISQIGDLFASLIKREHGVKDYSSMLPGHGGIMDRFDSVVAICGVLYVICRIFPPVMAI